MMNEIRGAIEAKFYDQTSREWRGTVELLIGNSLWRNYTEEGVRNIEANVAMNLRLGYANRINPTVESVLESVYQPR